MMTVENESSSNEAAHEQIQKKKTVLTKKRQKYNSDWEKDENFKGWLTMSELGKDYFRCTVCMKDYSAKGGKSELTKHVKTNTHKKKSSARKGIQPVTDAFKHTTTQHIKVKTAEIKLSAFVVEYNYSFRSVGPLVKLLQNILPDSEILKKITCDRTKCTSIIKNVIGQYCFQELITTLQNTKFSLLVDESTDVSSVKQLAMVVRYVDETQIVDQFLALLPVHDATANNLYKVVTTFFDDNKIPWKTNMIGYGSDGANNVSGSNHSLGSLLQQNSSTDLFRQKCICHSWDRCASDACKQLSQTAETLVRNIHNYFAHSYKRKHKLELVQEILNLEQHKLLMYSSTRWLSLHQVVKRYLEQWEALLVFFKAETKAGDDPPAATTILNQLEKVDVKMTFEFLDAVLPNFTELNREMQSTSTKIHLLYDKVSTVYKNFLSAFLKPSYLKQCQSVEKVHFQNPHNQIEIEKIYLGGKLMDKIANNNCKMNPSELHDFRLRCHRFYIDACTGIIKRFDFADNNTNKIKKISIINPVRVIKGDDTSIISLVKCFPTLVPTDDWNQIDREWRELMSTDLSQSSTDIYEFWNMIFNLQYADGRQQFSKLSSFVINLLVLPHSTAAVERLFSAVNLNKTELRNRMENDTLTGIMHTKSLLKNTPAAELKITDKLLVRHKSTMYNNQEKKNSTEIINLDYAEGILL